MDKVTLELDAVGYTAIMAGLNALAAAVPRVLLDLQAQVTEQQRQSVEKGTSQLNGSGAHPS